MRSSADVTRDWARALQSTKSLFDARYPGLYAVVQERAATHGDAPALIGETISLSYAGLARRANQYARWALAQGFQKGDVVGLSMANCPEYVAIWLGLTAVGCVVALLNTNVTEAARAQLIAAANIRTIITQPLPLDVSSEPLAPNERRPPQVGDRALLIFTSGTTGLPKAVNVTHARILEWSGWFAGMMDATPDDRLYDCLPMYHSVGGIASVGAMLVAGGAVIVRERFSASRFWPDIAESRATIFQYIGELCRYLLRAERSKAERTHRLRLACGNGLRGDIWQAFQDRFAIPRVLEFYAASEGCVSLTNAEAAVGSVGRVPRFLAHRYPLAVLRLDAETGQPLRAADGLCVPCTPDEAGELVGRVGESSLRFDGYTDKAATAEKFLADVLVRGDRWYRTGDLMKQDEAGFFYFVDRLGDTFRWKGENVSTTEVAAAIQSCPGVVDALVFGVAVPGADGKAGMAALVAAPDFDLADLRRHLAARLPSYAQPLFVRLCASLEATGTFRVLKSELVGEGFRTADGRVWFDDRKAGAFVPCDAALLARIDSGAMAL